MRYNSFLNTQWNGDKLDSKTKLGIMISISPNSKCDIDLPKLHILD